MILTANVELYTGKLKETVKITLTEDELREMFEKKAIDQSYCDSAKTKDIELKVDL